MPTFDLRGIKIAKYGLTPQNQITYTSKTRVGDAMDVNLEFRHAEARLYAESSLAEYMRKATGGSISIAVKYIIQAAQKLMYGGGTMERSVSVKKTGSDGQETTSTVKVSSDVATGKDVGNYVGVSFYAPDKIDGVDKFTCVHVVRSLFGRPSMAFKTVGEQIVFQTPTASGEFLPSTDGKQTMVEVAVVDDEETAEAWTDAVLSEVSS